MRHAAVMGIGNSFAHDDGAGLAAARILRGMCHPAVQVFELDGEPTRLIEAWDGVDRAFIVDAAASGAPAGTIHRLGGDEMGNLGLDGRRSSHGAGLAEAYRLGQALDRLPGSLVVYAIEGTDFRPGVGLSPAVAWAAGDVASRVRDELMSCVRS